MDPNSSSVVGQPLLYPKSVIPSKFSNQTIVTDVSISRGTTLGPYPGNDAVEERCNNWMQYVTSVTDYWEANLLVAFSKNQLYFHCNRNISAGTELIVWGGQKKIHLRDPSEWTTYKMNETGLTYLCQECDMNFKTAHGVAHHTTRIHQALKLSEKDCKCPHCLFVACRKNVRRHLVRHGIDLYGDPLLMNQNKEIEDSETKNNSAKILTARKDAITENNIHLYNCKLCKMTFKRLRQLCGHMGAKHKHYKSGCSKIASKRKLDSRGVGFASQCSTGNNEILGKQNTIEYKCSYCEKTFCSRKSRSSHKSSAHSGIRFVCSVCKNKFTFKSNLNRHLQTLHNSQGYIITMKNGLII